MAQLLSDTFEILHDQSVPAIELLQNSFPNSKDFMISISTLLDPRYVFLVYAPILFALNKKVAHRTILALTITEWTNQILKWLLAGERPYWYVHERAEELGAGSGAPLGPVNATRAQLSGIESYDAALYLSQSQQQPAAAHEFLRPLKQFPVTCELGAGSPSGHAMVTATVWYILVDAYLKGELPLWSRAPAAGVRSAGGKLGQRQSLERASWALYSLVLVLVSLSRVYLACHFPHQCLCGALLGVAVARLVVERAPVERLRPRHFALATGFMFLSAMATYGGLRAAGRNPLWSVDKGMRWCVKKEYIHLDTTPFFSMMRYLGFCLGAGLAYRPAPERVAPTRASASSGARLLARRSVAALGSILAGRLLMSAPIPRGSQQLFYLISFLLYVLFAYSIAGPIPRIAKQTLTPADRRRESALISGQ